MVKPAADLAGFVTSGSFANPGMTNVLGMGGPRTFWRGENPGNPQRITTGNPSWDGHLFMSSDKDAAAMYGKTLTQYQAAPDAKILYEGTPEFRKVAGTPRRGDSLLDFSARAADAAKAAGYDAVHFARQGDVGTAVFNPDKFFRE